MTSDEQTGFTFVDKRRTADSAGAVAPTASDAAADAPAGTESDAATQAAPVMDPSAELHQATDAVEAMHHLSVRDRIIMCIDILNQGAWIALGLVRDPVTGEVTQDLGQAKAAIDSVAFLAGQIESEFDEETRREVRNLVRDLQLNFVQQSQRAQAGD